MINILLTEARSWLGTPWKHNHCVKGEGVDCVNFIAACGQSLGLFLELPKCYERSPSYDVLGQQLSKHMRKLNNIDLPIIGTIVAFQYRGIVHHVAIATSETTIIHACYLSKKVVEQQLTKHQKARIVGFYGLKRIVSASSIE